MNYQAPCVLKHAADAFLSINIKYERLVVAMYEDYFFETVKMPLYKASTQQVILESVLGTTSIKK